MSIILLGGMDRLGKNYMEAASAAGHRLRHIRSDEKNFLAKFGQPDALFIFTGKISHEATNKAYNFARTRGIPIHFSRSCGVSTLKKFLETELEKSR